MITSFGKELRKIRIDKGEILKNMADKLQITSSYLSAIECGKRKIPSDFIDKLVHLYGLTEVEKEKLTEMEEESCKVITLTFDEISLEKKEVAIKFARIFKELSSNEIEKIDKILDKER